MLNFVQKNSKIFVRTFFILFYFISSIKHMNHINLCSRWKLFNIFQHILHLLLYHFTHLRVFHLSHCLKDAEFALVQGVQLYSVVLHRSAVQCSTVQISCTVQLPTTKLSKGFSVIQLGLAQNHGVCGFSKDEFFTLMQSVQVEICPGQPSYPGYLSGNVFRIS